MPVRVKEFQLYSEAPNLMPLRGLPAEGKPAVEHGPLDHPQAPNAVRGLRHNRGHAQLIQIRNQKVRRVFA